VSDEKRVLIVRAAHERDYYVASRKTAQDESISYEALGVLNYLLSKPDTWQANVKDIARRSTEYKIYKIFRELRKNGYLSLQKEKGKGRFSQWVYQVYEIKQLLENQQLENQLVEKRHTKRIENPTRVQKKQKSSDNTNTSGAVAPVTKPSKPREPDLIFDAVARGHGMNPDEINGKGGRIAMIANWLKGTYSGKGMRDVGLITHPASVQHIEQFFSDWPKDSTPPLDFVKFVENWRKWATKKSGTNKPAFKSLIKHD
jgi:hypothetical protein